MFARELECRIEDLRVLVGASFEVPAEGGMVGFYGDSNSGAAELALMLCGLLPNFIPVTIGGSLQSTVADLHDGAWGKRDVSLVGYVGPEPSDQIVGLTVDAELDWAWATSRRSRGAAESVVASFLEGLQLDALSGRSTYTLSSGQRQRLALASVAISHPTILLLDTCLPSLDEATVELVLDFAQASSHDGRQTWVVDVPGWRAELEDHVVVLSSGAVVETNPTNLSEYGVGESLELCEETLDALMVMCSERTLPAVGLKIKRILMDSELGGAPRLDVEGLELRPGSVLGLWGENGSGKSSLISAISGLETSRTRELSWGGTGEEPRIAVLPPEGVPFWAASDDDASAFDDGQAKAILRRLATSDRYSTVSRGWYRQRLHTWRRIWWVVRAVMLGVPWLLLDEPTTAMTREQTNLLTAVLRLHAKRQGVAVVASHDFCFLERSADRILQVRDGRVGEMPPASPAAIP